jgi:hypothetical protein
VSLSNVWVQMFDGSLVRADQVVGIELHRTPEIAGKPSRWLLDVVLPVSVGSGGGAHEGWRTAALHRTLTQSSSPPGEAPPALARLLARLDAADAAGVVRAEVTRTGADAGSVRVGFTAFADDDPDTPSPATAAAGGTR